MGWCAQVWLLSNSFKHCPVGGNSFHFSFVQHEPLSWVQPGNSMPLPVLAASKRSSVKKHRVEEFCRRGHCVQGRPVGTKSALWGKQMRWALELLVKLDLTHLCFHTICVNRMCDLSSSIFWGNTLHSMPALVLFNMDQLYRGTVPNATLLDTSASRYHLLAHGYAVSSPF